MGQDQADHAREFSSDGGDAVQGFAGVEFLEGQFGQIYVSAVVNLGWGRFGPGNVFAENSGELHLAHRHFSCDF
jgi:hypothetical protein